MKRIRQCACAVLLIVFTAVLFAELLAPGSSSTQFRESPDAASSWKHPMGTDELGRDRFARLLYGSRVSLLLAPSAALLSTVLAALVGGFAGYMGGWWQRVTLSITDLFLSLPWLFLLLTVRALLPLNVSPVTSVFITFALLGLLGWAASARVVCAGTRALLGSEILVQARALGCHGPRLLLWQVLPNLKPVLYAQFWISIPVFILAEANLGLMGLGVNEPLPSWGNLLRELINFPAIQSNPWLVAPLVLLVLVVSSFQLILSREENLT